MISSDIAVRRICQHFLVGKCNALFAAAKKDKLPRRSARPTGQLTGRPALMMLVHKNDMKSRFGQLNQRGRETLPKLVGCWSPQASLRTSCSHEEMRELHPLVGAPTVPAEDP